MEKTNRNLEYLLTVTAEGKVMVNKRDYDKMYADSDKSISIDQMKWIDKNVFEKNTKAAFVPAGKKKVMLITSKEREVEVALRDIFGSDFVQAVEMQEGESLRSFKFV